MLAQTCLSPTTCYFNTNTEGEAQQLDITAGGSFMCETTTEGEALLDRILENTSFTETLPLVEPSSYEEVPLIESASSPLNNPDSTTEPSP